MENIHQASPKQENDCFSILLEGIVRPEKKEMAGLTKVMQGLAPIPPCGISQNYLLSRCDPPPIPTAFGATCRLYLPRFGSFPCG
jgi:hypothetical protein